MVPQDIASIIFVLALSAYVLGANKYFAFLYSKSEFFTQPENLIHE